MGYTLKYNGSKYEWSELLKKYVLVDTRGSNQYTRKEKGIKNAKKIKKHT